MKKERILLLISLLFFASSYAQKEFVQQIFLDKPVIAGPLKVFPMLDNPNNYLYLPNKLRLGKHDNGEPQFLFLKYVSNTSSGDADQTSSVGNGGGYVHVLVGLHVLPEELEEAKQELKRINPRGVIVGPVVYRGGTMALVTKSVITNSSPENADQKRVLGVGPAPVMEGDNVAVSFVLNALDATLLWESLKSSTPDLSFNLNMTIGGYQSPIGFKIEMNWDKVYKHKIFNVGMATPVLKTEIGIASQQLKEDGSIIVTQVGEDANLQRLQETITNKLMELCFVPFGSEGSPNWAELAKPYNDGKSYLDRASEQLNNERLAAERRNKEIRDEEDRRRRLQLEVDKNRTTTGSTGTTGPTGTTGTNRTDTTRATSRLFDAFFDLSEPVRVTPKTGDPNSLGPAFKDPKNFKNADKPIEDLPVAKKEEESLPSIAVVASYQQKSIRHTGKYTAEAKTIFATSLAEPFAGNIGKPNCRDCIRMVNTFDIQYTQRELVCFLDGEIANDFTKYINYVTVMMRKKHAGGDITTAEVRVDRKNFNKEGNRFKLLYGWMQGDNDRKNWLNYEYKTTWNFFGGSTLETDWRGSDQPVIGLSAPVTTKTINVIADPARIKENNIRSVTVTFFYNVGGLEQTRQVSLNLNKEVFATSTDILLLRNQIDYEYQVTWLKGNSQVKSARMKSSQADIYVDEIQ
ncbi:MAG: hypothetical protein ACT4OJ_04615 [Bacteroidota bacterium]